MTPQEAERQTVELLTELHRELTGKIPPENVSAVGRAQYKKLCQHASVREFIPLLVYRSQRKSSCGAGGTNSTTERETRLVVRWLQDGVGCCLRRACGRRSPATRPAA